MIEILINYGLEKLVLVFKTVLLVFCTFKVIYSLKEEKKREDRRRGNPNKDWVTCSKMHWHWTATCYVHVLFRSQFRQDSRVISASVAWSLGYKTWNPGLCTDSSFHSGFWSDVLSSDRSISSIPFSYKQLLFYSQLSLSMWPSTYSPILTIPKIMIHLYSYLFTISPTDNMYVVRATRKSLLNVQRMPDT